MVLYITIDVYTAIMNTCLLVAFVAQWVEHVNIVIFKLCVVSSNPVRDIYYCSYCKDFCFYFIRPLVSFCETEQTVETQTRQHRMRQNATSDQGLHCYRILYHNLNKK